MGVYALLFEIGDGNVELLEQLMGCTRDEARAIFEEVREPNTPRFGWIPWGSPNHFRMEFLWFCPANAPFGLLPTGSAAAGRRLRPHLDRPVRAHLHCASAARVPLCAGQERSDVGGELGVVLEEEAVR